MLYDNIIAFFSAIGGAFGKAFSTDFVQYFEHLSTWAKEFPVGGWIMVVIVNILQIAFLVFLFIKLIQLLTFYIKFRRKEIEKDELLYEIAELNQKTSELIEEKNKIMAMKIAQIGSGIGYGDDLIDERALGGQSGYGSSNVTNNYNANQAEEEIDEYAGKRFTKLTQVDEKYSTINTAIVMGPDNMVTLPQLIERFVNFSASQMRLYYTTYTISLFFAGMATGRIIILEGISGTGKTSLPYSMSKFFNNNANIVSVQPSWRDKAEIIGYLNEFTKKFNETDFLKALYEINYKEDINYIVLDEMNLARIEYYFAEFLSIMEMPDINEWKIDLVPKQENNDPKKLTDGKVMVPQNVWFIGTANKDDSTFTITDKVYDRATTIFLNAKADFFDAPLTNPIDMSYEYLKKLYDDGFKENTLSLKNVENLKVLDNFIQDNFKIAFGNRIMRQIKTFVPAFMSCGQPENVGLDYIIGTKILKKFESLNLAFLKDEIMALINLIGKIYGKDGFTYSVKYLRDLYKMS
jgi:large-conductance mechanosensitive channel